MKNKPVMMGSGVTRGFATMAVSKVVMSVMQGTTKLWVNAMKVVTMRAKQAVME